LAINQKKVRNIQVEICYRELGKASTTDELIMTPCTLFHITAGMVNCPQLDIAVVTSFGKTLDVILGPHSLQPIWDAILILQATSGSQHILLADFADCHSNRNIPQSRFRD
jgi:hypothetical protein